MKHTFYVSNFPLLQLYNFTISDRKSNKTFNGKQSNVKIFFWDGSKCLKFNFYNCPFCICLFSLKYVCCFCEYAVRVSVIMEEEDVFLGCSEFYSLPLWDLWHFPFYFLLHYRKTIFSEEYINSTKYVLSRDKANSLLHRTLEYDNQKALLTLTRSNLVRYLIKW